MSLICEATLDLESLVGKDVQEGITILNKPHFVGTSLQCLANVYGMLAIIELKISIDKSAEKKNA